MVPRWEILAASYCCAPGLLAAQSAQSTSNNGEPGLVVCVTSGWTPKGLNDNLCHYTLSGKLRVLEEFFGEYVTPVPKEFVYGRSDGRTS